MFPFNLPGPQFLVFYLAFALVVLVASAILMRRGGIELDSYGDLTSDPYLIAYLRGGPTEMVKVAVFNLIDRDILEYDGAYLSKGTGFDPNGMRRPFDRVLVSVCAQPIVPRELLADRRLDAECDKYKADLQSRGLLPDGDARRGHWKILAIVVGLLAGVAIVKIVVALGAGRTNVGALIVFALGASLFAVRVCLPRRTPAGHATLSGLHNLLKRLRDNASRLRAGGRTNEALLLAAVAGVDALPAAEFAGAHQLFPVHRSTGGSGDSSGSSCSSGSSGCGGGGGCGGCGG
jgi:uncharacterized protein (TIGR04222 family)